MLDDLDRRMPQEGDSRGTLVDGNVRGVTAHADRTRAPVLVDRDTVSPSVAAPIGIADIAALIGVDPVYARIAQLRSHDMNHAAAVIEEELTQM